MAEVDTSSYPRPQPPQNPLDQILKVGQTADVLGNIEVGKGMQAAIQPDGSVDRNALAQVLKGSIAGSMKAPEALTSIERLRQAGHIADQAGIESTLKQLDFTGQVVGDLAAKGSVSKEELTSGAGRILNNAMHVLKLSPSSVIPHVAQVLSELNGNPNITPQQRAAALKQLQFQSVRAREQIELDRQRGEWVDNGQRHVFSPVGSQRNPAIGQTIQNQIRPDVQQPGPNNQPTFRGTQPDSLLPSEQPTSGGKPVKLAQSGDGTTYGVPRGGPAAAAPGAAEAQREVGAISGKNLAADLDASKNYQRTVFPLEKAIPALEKLGTTGTGPGTSEINNVKSFLLSMGVPGVNVEKIKNYDEANKYLVDFVNQTGNSGTNDKLAAAFSGNPSTKISNAAAQDVAKAALALQKMQRAQLSMFQKSGLPDDQYSKFTSSNALKLDPRAFGIDYMKPEQVKKMLESMKGDKDDIKSERGKFFYSLREAHDAGLLKERQ